MYNNISLPIPRNIPSLKFKRKLSFIHRIDTMMSLDVTFFVLMKSFVDEFIFRIIFERCP